MVVAGADRPRDGKGKGVGDDNDGFRVGFGVGGGVGGEVGGGVSVSSGVS